MFPQERFVYKEKGFTHTLKKFTYIHKTNPLQILKANSCGKFTRQKATANNCGKFSRQKATVNCCGKFPRQIAMVNSHDKKPRHIAATNSHGKKPPQITFTNICKRVPTTLLLTHLITKGSLMFYVLTYVDTCKISSFIYKGNDNLMVLVFL